MTSKLTKQWVRSKVDELAVDAGCSFDLKAADRVRGFFFQFLRHSKGQFANKPFELLPWQWERFVAPLFGWRRKDGTRRYRKAGVWIPKKNGKSALASGISLYMLLGDGEPGSEVYNAAADREQASIVYNEAANMVEASPSLLKRLQLVRSSKRIIYPSQKSLYKALSADAPTKEGINWHALIVDELHAQKKRDLWDTLVYGGRARKQPLLLTISTAGYDRNSIGWEQYQYAKGVEEGRVEDIAFLPVIYEATPADDWTLEATWKKANPSYGAVITYDSFKSECDEAKASPAKENAFRRYLLNQWTEQETRWLSLDSWDKCGKELAELEDRECVAGLDLSSTKDLTALVLSFPAEDGSVDVLPFFWVPEDTIRERETKDRVPYSQWVKRGLITPTPGSVVDYSFVKHQILKLRNLYRLQAVAFDRWNAVHLATELQGEGVEMVGFGQGFASMSGASKQLEKLVLAGKLRHAGNPVLRWNAGNVTVEQDAAGNVKPSKSKSTERIDGVVALIMSLGILQEATPAVKQALIEVW